MSLSVFAKKEKSPQRILFLVSNLLVLKKTQNKPPIKSLVEFCKNAIYQDISGAIEQYSQLCSDLVASASRRVTGDIWKDFLFGELFECENIFSTLAAQNKIDPPLQKAMEHDLKVVQELFLLSSEDLIAIINNNIEQNLETTKPNFEKNINNTQTKKQEPAGQENKKNNNNEENIRKMAFSAWAGGQEVVFEKPKQKPIIKVEIPNKPEQKSGATPVVDETQFFAWNYDEPGEHEHYASDEALAELYRSFLTNENWGENTTRLWEFHKNFGTKSFLRFSSYIATDQEIIGKNNFKTLEWDEVFCLGNQKEKIYANTLRFLHTSQADNMLLFGHSGMGKSALVYSILQELSQLKLVVIAHQDFSKTISTIQKLFLQQYLKFVVLFVDADFSNSELSAIKAIFDFQQKTGATNNVLIYATSKRGNIYTSFFGQKIKFEAPDLNQFKVLVCEMLGKSGVYYDVQEVERVCETFHSSHIENVKTAQLNVIEAHQIAAMLTRQYRKN